MRTKTFALALLLPALILSACGRLNDEGGAGSGGSGATGDSGSGGSPAIDHPTGASDLILRVETGGGFVMPSFTLRSVPGFSLYGDGRLIVEGPMIEIYPGPALPNLQVMRLSEEAVQAILEAAGNADLLVRDTSYDYNCIADAATTTFTVTADGATHTVSAYALGMDQDGGSCQGSNVDARTKLQDFATALGDLQSWLPAGSIGASEEYTPSEMRVYVQPYQADPQLEEPAVDWPLAAPLGSFGEPDPNLSDARCGVVSGADFDALLPLVRSANELTPWSSDGTDYGLIFRPLLPDEHAC